MPDLRRLVLLAAATSSSMLGGPALASGAYAAAASVDCDRGESLADNPILRFPGAVVSVKGTCAGPVTLTADGVKLVARGAASIDGGGKDAVTVTGAQRVTLRGLEITGGLDGVVVQRGAHVTLSDVAVTGNARTGILVQSGSTVALDGGSSSRNGLAGLDVEATSAVSVTRAYAATGNGVFGLQVNNGSSLGLNAASLTVAENTVGLQLGTNSSAFMDARSKLDTSRNATVGLTMVSGAHMVSFGGAITSGSNGLHGISVNSRAGLDLDAAAQVHADRNGGDGVRLEQLSVMTIFNDPRFSQAQGATLVGADGNGGAGIDVLTGSRILVDNYAALRATSNVEVGIAVDDGSALAFGRTGPVSGVTTVVTGNPVDLRLTFGSRLTYLENDTFGVVQCDPSTIVRGPGGVHCAM